MIYIINYSICFLQHWFLTCMHCACVFDETHSSRILQVLKMQMLIAFKKLIKNIKKWHQYERSKLPIRNSQKSLFRFWSGAFLLLIFAGYKCDSPNVIHRKVKQQRRSPFSKKSPGRAWDRFHCRSREGGHEMFSLRQAEYNLPFINSFISKHTSAGRTLSFCDICFKKPQNWNNYVTNKGVRQSSVA